MTARALRHLSGGPSASATAVRTERAGCCPEGSGCILHQSYSGQLLQAVGGEVGCL